MSVTMGLDTFLQEEENMNDKQINKALEEFEKCFFRPDACTGETVDQWRIWHWAKKYKTEIIQALENAQIPEWQPIETAPKDGTQFIVSDGECIAIGEWANYPEPIDVFDPTCHGIFKDTDKITHWRPLPARPEVTCKEFPIFFTRSENM